MTAEDRSELTLVAEHIASIERHWTTQLEAQQQRLSILLAANGALLGLLLGAILSNPHRAGKHHSLEAGAALLTLAMALGALALLPRKPRERRRPPDEDQPSQGLGRWFMASFLTVAVAALPSRLEWLDARLVWNRYTQPVSDTDPRRSDWLWQHAESLARNAGGGVDHHNTRQRRTALMCWQILALVCSGALIVFYLSTIWS